MTTISVMTTRPTLFGYIVCSQQWDWCTFIIILDLIFNDLDDYPLGWTVADDGGLSMLDKLYVHDFVDLHI